MRRQVVPALAMLLFSSLMTARGAVQKPAKKELSPEEIIQAFTAKETEAYEAWSQYYYRQVASVKVLSVDGRPSKEAMTLVFEIVFRDDGSREVKQIEKTGRLREVIWTPEDEDVITNYQPFALTTKDLPDYTLKYEGKEQIDELDTYVFSVKPKEIKEGSFYFQGKIWVDNVDLQIVRTVGKVVPQTRESQYPEFETLRQIVDDKYWFPAWSHADSVLDFPGSRVHLEETITYEGFKQFKTSVKVTPIKK
jgi:hypothetical protein